MKKNKPIQKQTIDTPRTHIPDFEIIDLEQNEPPVTEKKQEMPTTGFFKKHLRPKANTPQETPAPGKPVTSEPIQSEPAPTQTVPSKPVQAKPAPAQTVQSKPVQAKPATAQAVQSKPVQAKPATTQAVQSKPVQAKPATAQAVQSKPVQAKPATAQAVQSKPVQAKPATAQAVQSKPIQAKPAQIQPIQASEPEQPKSVQPEPQTSKPVTIEPTWEEPADALDIREEDLHIPNKKKQINFSALRPYINTHILLLAVFLIFVVSIVVKFMNWGERIDLSEIEHDKSGTYLDVLDQILPLTDRDGKPISTGKVDTILAFGNAPFADDRDSKDNLANMIAESTGATVYNCSVSGSYMAAQHPFFNAAEAPMDAYSFYWLVTLAVGGANAHNYADAAEALGENTPPEAQEVYDTLTTLDLNTVDVITIMYDASDYLMGNMMYSDENPTDIQYFTGNLEAGIELLQDNYPNIRIIVMSPTYAYAVDENGEYVSSDMYRYGQDVLSTYVIKEYASCASRSVSFIDHLYGTITEANAPDYLVDNLHLNTAGRKLVAERFLKVLNYYNK